MWTDEITFRTRVSCLGLLFATAFLIITAVIMEQVKRLPGSPDAEYRKGQQTGKRTGCLPGTREGVRDTARDWDCDPRKSPILWLNGMAGTGKSTVADSFTADLEAAGFTVASHFCSRDYPSASNVTLIFFSLAAQLAYKNSAYASALAEVLKKIQYPQNLSPEEQLVRLILNPLKGVGDRISHPVSFVADAIDECSNGRKAIGDFIHALLAHGDDLREAHVKFFISSRPADEILTEFQAATYFEHLILHEVDEHNVYSDIRMFIAYRFRQIRRRHSYFDFQEADVDLIATIASPLFIFAATVCAFIEGSDTAARRDPMKQLTLLRTAFASGDGSGDQATRALDVLYQYIFVKAFMATDGVTYDDALQAEDALIVVASILLVSEPLGFSAHTMLLNMQPPYRARHLLMDLFSIVTNPSDDIEPVRILHASLQDHLTNPSRAHPSFHINPEMYHGILATRCLELMMERLTKDNICSLTPGVLSTALDIDALRVQFVPPALHYASVNWSYHLRRSSPTHTTSVLDALTRFSDRYLLRWVEVLSLTKGLDNACTFLYESEAFLSVRSVNLCLSAAT